MKIIQIFAVLLLSGCAGAWRAPDDFTYVPIVAGDFEIATLQKISNNTDPIHIYIEGDGHAFNGRGMPTSDPTPRGTFVRDLVASDPAPNVIYMARPCQYIMYSSCRQTDWTNGRFSPHVIDSMATAIKSIIGTRPVILIGYSGGAMVSGLIINTHPEINVIQWITIAGVLNHNDWTNYFGDSPLTNSMDMNNLPDIPQIHYVGTNDETVPVDLAFKWARPENIEIVQGAKHDDFGDININFIK